MPSGRVTADGTLPRLDDTTLAALPVATLTILLISRLGTRGTIGSSASRSSGTSLWWISACLIAARIPRRSVVGFVGSTVTSTSSQRWHACRRRYAR